MFALLNEVASPPLVFGFSEIVQFVLAAFSIGGLFTSVLHQGQQIKDVKESHMKAMQEMERRHQERIELIEANHEKLERRFLKAIEDLGDSLARLSTELKTVLAVHETRLNLIERETFQQQ